MKIGYSFWGHLADFKMHNGLLSSTPDGNAFYSWCIMRELMKQGNEVVNLMPNRDKEAYKAVGPSCFGSYEYNDRAEAYLMAKKTDLADSVVSISYMASLHLDAVLLEWRFPIPGRNTSADIHSPDFQPDYLMQKAIITVCKHLGIKIIAFDLDYKMKEEDVQEVDFVIELGYKWINNPVTKDKSMHVEIPFNFEYIHNFPILPARHSVVYIGNRYERDDMVDKYLAPIASETQLVVYGNWLESGRDSKQRWPDIHFMHRAQFGEFRGIYMHAAVAPILLKQEYNENGFMTARIIETVFFGCVPVIPVEFGMARRYVPGELIVKDHDDLLGVVDRTVHDYKYRRAIIDGLRSSLSFMDTGNFVKALEEIVHG